MRSLERPVNPRDQQEIEGEWIVRLSDMQLSADIIDSIKAAHRVLLREPERSRRVVKLLCANWLAHVETPEQRPRKPAVRALLAALKPMSVALYPVSPDAPAGARATTAGARTMAGHDPRRQAANAMAEAVATESSCLPPSPPRPRDHAGLGALSP